jgi:hypothetical protein
MQPFEVFVTEQGMKLGFDSSFAEPGNKLAKTLPDAGSTR